MLLWLLRCFYLVLLVAVAAFAFSLMGDDFGLWAAATTALGILALGGVVFYTDVKEKSKQIGTISAVYLGLLLGLLLAYLFSLGLMAVLESLVDKPEKLAHVAPVLRGA